MKKVCLCIALSSVVCSSITAATQAVGIVGLDKPCSNTTSRYSYCPSVFPYVWAWKVSGTARVETLQNSDTCYFANLTFTDTKAVALTFEQSNPIGVPQVYNVRKMITPNSCKP